MTAASGHIAATDGRARPMRHDSLALSVVFLVGLSCVQPVVTFGRGVIFCRWLSPEQLGCWDLALSFLTLAAPVVVMGIPGSFGRYVEHYRQHGQLSVFLRRTTLVCVVSSVLSVVLIVGLSAQFSSLIFGRPDYDNIVYLIAACLAAMIAFGFVVELLTALRIFRIVSILHFIKGVSFAMIGAGLLLAWVQGPASIIAGYALACFATSLVALFWLVPTWRSLPQADQRERSVSVPRRQFWARLFPFAASVWATNALANLFEIIDRYMIVHFSEMTNEVALEQVGHYHSSRIVPLLFVTFATMLASVILPHLTRDWEAGRRGAASDLMVLCLKMCVLFLSVGCTVVLLFAPWLFEVGFEGKYSGGLAVLPWTLTYCAWTGMIFLAEMYLWCAEKVRLCGIAIAIGVVVNIVLNLLLLPLLGLLGAVLATAASKLLVLVIVYWFAHSLELRFDWRMWALTFLPLIVCLGPVAAVASIAVVGLAVLSTRLVLSEAEKRQLAAVIGPAWLRIRSYLAGAS